MPDLPWLRIFPREFLADPSVAAMDADQVGGYWLLCCYAWNGGTREPSLPGDDATLARMSRMGRRWKSAGAFVRDQLEDRGDGRLYVPWLSKTWSASLAGYEKRATAGRKGGIAKALLQLSPGNATAMPRRRSSKAVADMPEQSSSKPVAGVLQQSSSNQNQNQKESRAGPLQAPALRSLAPTAGAAAPGGPRPRGAERGEHGAPGNDSDPGRAVATAGADEPRSIEAVTERLADIVPRRMSPRPSVVRARKRVIALLEADADERRACEQLVRGDYPALQGEPFTRAVVSIALKRLEAREAGGGDGDNNESPYASSSESTETSTGGA